MQKEEGFQRVCLDFEGYYVQDFEGYCVHDKVVNIKSISCN